MPKLNLTPLLREQEEHAQNVKDVYAEASAEAEDVPTAHEGACLPVYRFVCEMENISVVDRSRHRT